MERIVLNVDDVSGMQYRQLSPENKQQFNIAVNILLKRIVNTRNLINYQQMLDSLGKEAESKGLTPDILEAILNEPNE